MIKTHVIGTYFDEFEYNGKNYEIYGIQSNMYNIYTDVEQSTESGRIKGKLIKYINLGPGFNGLTHDYILIEIKKCFISNESSICSVM